MGGVPKKIVIIVCYVPFPGHEQVKKFNQLVSDPLCWDDVSKKLIFFFWDCVKYTNVFGIAWSLYKYQTNTIHLFTFVYVFKYICQQTQYIRTPLYTLLHTNVRKCIPTAPVKSLLTVRCCAPH
jgi:hypothetical protein